MSDKVSGMLASATSVLKRAVELDTGNRLAEAVTCYQEGLQLLMDVLKVHPNTEAKEGIRTKMKQYMSRAEELKLAVEREKEAGKYHEQIHIENNSCGHSYERLFKRFLDEDLTEITIEDPYIRSNHQLFNLLRFCEMVVKLAGKVRHIRLTTGRDETPSQHNQQDHKLEELRTSLSKYNIQLSVEFSSTLHDREIRFNNGWIVKIGRGLDMYKAVDGKFSVGFCDFDLRKCHETTIDIFHSKNVSKSHSAEAS